MNQLEKQIEAIARGGKRHLPWQAWTVLLAGLVATGLACLATKSGVDEVSKREFEFGCNEIRSKIVDRLSAHEQILRSSAAFVEHTGRVTRQEWHVFTERQQVAQRLPGIQGIGFALRIPRDELARHVREIRAEGFPEYQVRPPGERDVFSSIIYLEPFTDRNLRAFGYDMLSEPVRRAAMEQAADQDSTALSGKVVLVQETDKDVQSGTLMYVPVYLKGMPHETPVQRRAALLGWVYSPYRMNDLMKGILGGWDLKEHKRIHLEVFDGDGVPSEALLYDSQPGTVEPRSVVSRLTRIDTISSAGRQWTLRFSPTLGQSVAKEYTMVWLVLFGGTSASLLLTGWLLSELSARFKAQQIAGKLRMELEQREELYGLLLKNMRDGFAYCRMVFDDQGRPIDFIYLAVNRAFEEMTGLQNVVGRPVTDVIPNIRESNQEIFETYGRVVRTGRPEKFEVYLPSLARWLSVSATSAGNGCFAAIVDDIGERRRAEATLRESEARARAMLQAVPDMMFRMNSQGVFVDYKADIKDLYAQSEPSLIGKRNRDITPPEFADLIEHQIRTSLVTRTMQSFDYQLSIPGRGVRDYEARMVASGEEEVTAIVRDTTERKRAETALQSASKQLTSVLEGTRDAIAMMDTGYRYTLFNSAFHEEFKRLFGLDLKIGDSMVQALAHVPNDLADAMKYWNRALAGEDFTITQQFGDPKLERNWYELHISPIRDGEGKVAGAVQIVRNAAERKQAEAALERSFHTGKLLRSALVAISACPDIDSALACLVQRAIDLGDIDCGGAYVIEGQEAVLRHQFDLDAEFVAKVARLPMSTDYVQAVLDHPQEIYDVIEHFPARRQLGEQYGLRHVYSIGLAINQRAFGLLNMASRRTDPPSTANLGLIRILALETESLFLRLRTEERLRRLGNEQRVILDNTAVGIGHVQARKVVWANSAHDTILGYAQGETVGMDAASFYASQEDRERVGREGYEQLAKGGNYTSEVELRRKDGSVFWCSIVGQAMDPSNLAEGSIWILQDTTERRRMTEALRTSEEHLTLAMEQAHLAHWEMDAATATFIFNDRFYALYGTTAEREGGYRMSAEVYAREFLPPEEQHIVAPGCSPASGRGHPRDSGGTPHPPTRRRAPRYPCAHYRRPGRLRTRYWHPGRQPGHH